jgi:proteasome lid subunit RPN8/RPN11
MRLPIGLRLSLLGHMMQYPGEEICGFIGGLHGVGLKAYPVENLWHSPSGYMMDPLEQYDALQDIEADGLELVAVYHTHPHSLAVLSPEDNFAYPDVVQLIWGQGIWRGWVLHYGKAEEIEVLLD